MGGKWWEIDNDITKTRSAFAAVTALEAESL